MIRRHCHPDGIIKGSFKHQEEKFKIQSEKQTELERIDVDFNYEREFFTVVLIIHFTRDEIFADNSSR